MHTFLGGVRLRYGSVEGYLIGIGVKPDALLGLRHALLEST